MRPQISWTFVGAFITAFGFAWTGDAAALTLDAGAPSASPPTILPGRVSDPLTFSVVNDAATPDKEFGGFTVRFRVLPLTGATGQVAIGAVTAPANPVFGSTNSFIANRPQPGNDVGVTDFTFGTPATIPTAPGSPLFNYTLEPSADALGDFGIYAVTDFGVTQWVGPSFTAQYFDNVGSGNDPVLLGVVTVVPEPISLALLGLGGLAFIRRNRRTKPRGTNR